MRECRRELRQRPAPGRAHRQRYNRYDYNRYEPGYNRYYADRYYRDGRYYADRRLTRNDRIYRGQNGQYYCRRNDGTTGLIVGGAVGALIGASLTVVDRAPSAPSSVPVPGALLGREIARGGLRCN